MPVETTTKKIGPIEIRITQLEPRKALTTFVRACAIFGEEGVRMISTGTVKVMEADTEAEQGSEESKHRVKVDMTGILMHVVKAFGEARPEDVLELADELLLGTCSVKTEDGWNEIPAGATGKLRMNELFPSVHNLLAALREALTFNFFPTGTAPGTSDALSDATVADK